MAGPKSEFWAKVIAECKAQEIKLSRVREKLGNINKSTFSSWQDRNKFPRTLVQPLAAVLHWEALNEALAVRMGVELLDTHALSVPTTRDRSFDKVLTSISGKYTKALKHFELYSNNSHRIFEALAGNCVFAFSSCTTNPYEFDNNAYKQKNIKPNVNQGFDIGRAIANALLKGTLCLYIRPTKAAIERYQQHLGDNRLVFHEEAVRQIDDFRQNMKHLLMHGKIDRQVSDAEASKIIYEQIDQCYIDEAAMWMPGIGLSFVGQPEKFKLKRRVILSLPNAMFGGALVCPEYDLLENRFIHFLSKVVTDACEELAAHKLGTTNGKVTLIVPDEHFNATELFYKSYSQILRTISSY